MISKEEVNRQPRSSPPIAQLQPELKSQKLKSAEQGILQKAWIATSQISTETPLRDAQVFNRGETCCRQTSTPWPSAQAEAAKSWQ